MNEKKKIIQLWSKLLIICTIINVIFLIFTIICGYIWAIIIEYSLFALNLSIFIIWIFSFNINYKKIIIENNEIEVYAGFCNHYIRVNGEIKDEYKSEITFTPIKMSCIVNTHKIDVTVSLSNNIVIKCDDELIK